MQLSETFWLIFYVYLAGYVIAFFMGMFALIRRLFSFNSIHRRNLRLILIKNTFLGRMEEYEEPEDSSFMRSLKEFGLGIFLHLFNSLLSWIQVLISLFVDAKAVITWLLMPSTIRAYQWKIKNIPFKRAEDFLKFSQSEGFTSHSDQLMNKTLEELSKKSERLTQIFATKVFGDDEAKIERYVSEARRLTREENDSVVISSSLLGYSSK